jgi:ribosomal protein L11 methylase PrmA
MAESRHAGSFRDPSGFIFSRDGKLYRQLNNYYKKEYDHLMDSGLYKELANRGWIVTHKEVDVQASAADAYKIIQPQKIDFVSYPYEWSFSQLKDAALLTLNIQQLAMEYGMGLKDASAYNIQFHNGKPVFIDTLSFEILDKPKPWVAYRQYCQHFLAPLALMAQTDIALSKLLRDYIDGIPLELAAKLLPRRSKFSFGTAAHIHVHARSQKRYASSAKKSVKEKTISQNALTGIINSLMNTTKKLNWKPDKTEWGEYYTFTNYNDKSFKNKKKIIDGFIAKTKPKSVWDLGANNGLFSRIASDKGISAVAFDIDPVAVEANYIKAKESDEKNILPILMDLTNPSPSLGWAHAERDSMEQRGPTDMVFALALIHHLAISNNLPLESVAVYFAKLSRYLVIEFVPKGDSQVDRLLATREDIFPDYTETGFEKAFEKSYKILEKAKVGDSKRTLYLMKKK